MIDTPGHVDFTYEVSRCLAACEGAVLLVDAAQGIEAQTLANLYLAMENDLHVIPVLNKIDLPAAQPEKYAEELAKLIGCEPDDVLRVSGKTGEGVEPPARRDRPAVPRRRSATRTRPARAMIFDSVYDVVPRRRHVRPGHRRPDRGPRPDQDDVHRRRARAAGDRRRLARDGEGRRARRRRGRLPDHRREGRPPVPGRRHRHRQQRGRPTEPLGGYKDPKPMVYSGLYPIDGSDYPALRDALDKLQLNDAALIYEPETSAALGFGFRVGFLGLLHLEIIGERLEREFNLDLISTAPNVVYRVFTEDAVEHIVTNPSEFPDGKIAEIHEPVVRATVLAPNEYVGAVMELCQSRRGQLLGMEYLSAERVELRYTLPLAEIIFDFFDQLKSKTKGYASLDYEPSGEQAAELVKVDILLHGEPVDAFSAIVHKDKAYAYGVTIAAKLQKLIPRQQFEVPIQAAIGSRIIARETIRAIRKDVLAKCYGGDITRKRKLLEKQKEGKKRMKMVGRVEVPQEAFIAALSTSDSVDGPRGSGQEIGRFGFSRASGTHGARRTQRHAPPPRRNPMTVTGIITALIVGLIIGALGRLVVPGKQNIPIWLTMVIGVVAALLGTVIARAVGRRRHRRLRLDRAAVPGRPRRDRCRPGRRHRRPPRRHPLTKPASTEAPDLQVRHCHPKRRTGQPRSGASPSRRAR